MRDTLSIESLIEALGNYTSACREEAEARERYDGPSWGYAGRYYIEARERAADDVQTYLNQYIDSRVALAISVLRAENK